jgi:SAM-dependent methyltransferase
VTTENPYRAAGAWAGEVAERWLACEAVLDRALAPFGDAALLVHPPAPGDRVLDVGCGTGATTATLAEAVGPTGHVLGVDIAPALLLRAHQRTAGLPQVELREADAQTVSLDRDRDLVFSRFGVMFFADVEAAFRNLVGALRPGGWLTFVCWREFQLNPWQWLPFAAMREALPAALPPPGEGPGPFSLSDPGRLRSLLAAVGLEDVHVDCLDRQARLGLDLPEAVHFAMNTGPTGRALSAASAEDRLRARERISAALARQLAPDGVNLAASAWLVHARAPAPGST